MPRRNHRLKFADQVAPAPHAFREGGPAELEVWQTETSEAHLRALRDETHMWAPNIATNLLTPTDEPPRYLVSYRNLGPFSIAWDEPRAAFVWTDGPKASEVAGYPADLTKTVRALAEVVNAPVRQM
jgi:hypothetical protein